MKISKADLPLNSLKRFLFILLLLLSLSLMIGCASKLNQVTLPKDTPLSWSFAGESELPIMSRKILDLLDDPIFDELAKESIENNPNLGATSDRLLSQASLLGVSKSRMWPSIGLDLSANRGRQGLDDKGNHKSESLYSAGVSVNWELDVWGKIRDGYKADLASLEMQRWAYTAARNSLISRTIQSWLRTISLTRSIRIADERIGNLEKIQKRILSRYRDGIGSIDELSIANTRILTAKADKAELVETNVQSIRDIELLLGRYPQNQIKVDGAYPYLAVPHLFQPGEVLVNRPDIQIAMEKVRAADLQRRVAKKAYLPSPNISGKLFKQSIRLSDITGGTLLWDMLVSVSQPIFDAGRIKSEIDSRKWQHSASVKELKAAVLTATHEVNKYWALDKMLGEKEKLLKSAKSEAARSFGYFEKRYLEGLDPIVNMLNAKEEQITIKAQINELQAARLINRIDLALALGLGESNE